MSQYLMQDKIKSPPGGTLKLSSLGPPVITSRDVDRIIYIDFLHYFTFPCSSLFPVTGLAQPLLSDPVLLNIHNLIPLFLTSTIFLLRSHPLPRALHLLRYNAILKFINILQTLLHCSSIGTGKYYSDNASSKEISYDNPDIIAVPIEGAGDGHGDAVQEPFNSSR